MKYNQSRSGFELVSSCPIPTITITPQAPHENKLIQPDNEDGHRRKRKEAYVYIYIIFEFYLTSFNKRNRSIREMDFYFKISCFLNKITYIHTNIYIYIYVCVCVCVCVSPK